MRFTENELRRDFGALSEVASLLSRFTEGRDETCMPPHSFEKLWGSIACMPPNTFDGFSKDVAQIMGPDFHTTLLTLRKVSAFSRRAL